MPTLRAAVVAALLALITAAPAAAIPGGHGFVFTLSAGTVTTADRAHSCQAGTGKSKALVGNRRKPAVVACEQPPKSQLVLPSVAKTTGAALDVLG